MTFPKSVEIAVIGAGPAGSTLAASLARMGHDVALFEKDQFPRNKVCGEFLSPEVIACLEELGCLQRFLELNPSQMTRTRLTASNRAELNLPLPGKAYGLSRRRLDAFLFEHAIGLGAQGYDGVDVRSVEDLRGGKKELTLRPLSTNSANEIKIRADLVVAAHGRRARLDRKLERPFFQERSPYIAFKRHFDLKGTDPAGELPPLRSTVELHTFKVGYCGVSFAEDNIVNVCTIFDKRLVALPKINADSIWKFLGKGSTPLARRLSTLRPRDGDSLAIAQIPLALKERSRREVLFVGDAAGMIAPLAGDGQAMAMESALAMARLLHAELPRVPYGKWHDLWHRRYANRIRLGQWLQRAMIRPPIAIPSIHILNRLPSVGRALIALTRS